MPLRTVGARHRFKFLSVVRTCKSQKVGNLGASRCDGPHRQNSWKSIGKDSIKGVWWQFVASDDLRQKD